LGFLVEKGRFRSAQELSNTGGRSVSEHYSVERPLHMKPIEVDRDEGAKGIETFVMAKGIREAIGERTWYTFRRMGGGNR